MARLTKEQHDNILNRLSDASNAEPALMEFVDMLRRDFDESLSVDYSEVNKVWEEKYKNVVEERDKALTERDEARKAYRDRFFTNADREAEKIVKNQKDESPKTPAGINEVLGIKEEDL